MDTPKIAIRHHPWQRHLIAPALGLAGVLVFTAINGYAGILHDAQVYAFQALARLKPEILGNDLFLRYGSQDSFSLFSRLYAPLIQLVGLPVAAMALALFSNALLFAGTGCLLRQERGWTSAWAGLLGVAIWPVAYGMESLLNVAEPFATPRPMACGASLLAMAHGLRDRKVKAGLWCLLALCLHPLMALPVPLVLLGVAFPPGRALFYLSLMGLSLVVGASLGLPILERLFLPMDPEWREVTLTRAPYLALSHWGAEGWIQAGLGVLGPMLIGFRLTGSLRRLYAIASLVGGLGLLVSCLGGDLASSLLILQVQPWRMTWLGHWLGVAGIGLIFMKSRETGKPADQAAWMGLAGAELAAPGVASPLILVYTWVMVRIQHAGEGRRTSQLIVGGGRTILAAACMAHVFRRVNESPYDTLLEIILTDPAIWAGLPMAAYAWRERVPQRFMKLVLMPAALSFMISAPLVYLKAAYVRESREFAPPREAEDIRAHLPRGGSVLWEPGPRNAWFRLGYPSYISRIQAAGTVFSRETAMAAARRSGRVEAVLGARDYMRWHADRPARTSPDPEAVLRLCADPELSAVYTKIGVPGDAAVVEVHDSDGAPEGRFMFCRGR